MTTNAPGTVALSTDILGEGLDKLLRMRPPEKFDFDRWAQIRRDCTKLIKDHGPCMCEFKWTLADVFGLDRGYCNHGSGLAVCLRGGMITRLGPRLVFVWRPLAGSSKWQRKSGWAKPCKLPLIWEGADVAGPVWHRPRRSPAPPAPPPAPRALPIQSGLSESEAVEAPTLFMPEHVFIAFTGPSCAIH